MLCSKHFSLVSSCQRAQPFLTASLAVTSWHLAVPFLSSSYTDVVCVASTGSVMIVRVTTARTTRTATKCAGPTHTKQRRAPCCGESPRLPAVLLYTVGFMLPAHTRDWEPEELNSRGCSTVQAHQPPGRLPSISPTLPNTVL